MNLFLRTFSQGLQAFVPIAAALVWCHAIGARRLAGAIARGLVLSIPASVAGAWMFRALTNQSLNEALLAAFAVAAAMWFTPLLRDSAASDSGIAAVEAGPLALRAVSAAACVVVVRQTMEV